MPLGAGSIVAIGPVAPYFAMYIWDRCTKMVIHITDCGLALNGKPVRWVTSSEQPNPVFCEVSGKSFRIVIVLSLTKACGSIEVALLVSVHSGCLISLILVIVTLETLYHKAMY